MPDDPLVREVREVRDRLAAKFNNDVDAIIRDLMARQRQISEGHTIVRDVSQAGRARRMLQSILLNVDCREN